MDVEIRCMKIDHADRSPCRRVIDRAKIKIAKLLWREQREAPATGNTAGQIVRKIIVRGDAGRCSHPQADPRITRSEVDPVCFVHSIEMGWNVNRGEIDTGWIAPPFVGINTAEDVGELPAGHAEIHVHLGTIEHPSVVSWLTDRYGELNGARSFHKIGARCPRRAQTRLYQRPVGPDPANHKGRLRSIQQCVQRRRVCNLPLDHRRKGSENRWVGFNHQQSGHSCVRPVQRIEQLMQPP